MATGKRPPKSKAPARAKTAARGGARAARPKGYTSPAWERVYLLSVELDALARDLGPAADGGDPDGFGPADAARELARLAGNHDRAANPGGRTPAQERDDWVAVAGLGADLGNMADEPAYAGVAGDLRPAAHEACYLACDFLF